MHHILRSIYIQLIECKATIKSSTIQFQLKHQPELTRTIKTSYSGNKKNMTSCTVDEKQLEKYYNVALNLVLKCGLLMREAYQKPQQDYKVKSAFYDLVTVHDKQIEDLLIEGLRNEFPESKFIAEEESAESHREAQLTDDPTWIIDPIDGTTNFVHKIPHCCISVGLTIGKELMVGIVFNPIANEMYSAWKGHGALLNGKHIHVTKCTKMKEALVGYEISLISNPKWRDKNIKRVYKIGSNSTGIRDLGSAALSLCYVANGSLDCYHIEDLKPWDIAAGAVILREAGGIISHTTGCEFQIMKPDLVAAATCELAKEIIQLIEEADKLTELTFK